MKIKHWQGYGTVNAKKISADKDTLTIEVRGMHEYGIVNDDKYDVFNWLVKRFDKNRKDYFEIESIDVSLNSDGDIEIATYVIHFRSNTY